MLYHYALLPDIFRSELLIKRPSAQVVLKQLLRGLCDNGLIANLHADAWVKHIDTDLLPLMLPTVQDDVRSCLRTLKDRNRLITCAPYSQDVPTNHEDWLDAAVDVHNRSELQGIVLTQALMNHYGLPNPVFIELSQVLDSPQWLARTHSLTVSMVQPDYETALIPVLRYAKTISLIDPYMTCHERRFWDVIEMCVRRLGKGRHRPDLSRIITIHSGDPRWVGNERYREDPVNRLQAWNQTLQPLANANPNLRFRVCLWSDSNKPERFHDRFLITDQCCISVPAGLDTRVGTTPWSLQDELVRQNQMQKFSDTSAAYNLLGKLEVSK